LVVAGCGHIGGNNVTGVAGGMAYSGIDERFVGRWAHYSPYEMTFVYLTFRPDGTCNYSVYQIAPVSSVEGNWKADGKRYRIDAAGFQP